MLSPLPTHCSPSLRQHASPASTNTHAHVGCLAPPQLRSRRTLHPPSVLKGSEVGSTQAQTTLQQLGSQVNAAGQPQPGSTQPPQQTAGTPQQAAATPAEVQGEFPAIFDYQHMPHFSLPLALYFPFGVVIGAARVALWIICIALDLPVFRNRSVVRVTERLLPALDPDLPAL